MRKTVLVPVEYTYCDAHIARDGSEVEATKTLALGDSTWHLCLEHNVTFGRYLMDALGVPEDASAEPATVAAESEPVTVDEPAPVAEPSPVVAECDAEDVSDEAAEPEPVPSVMISGEIDGYDWESAREAVRNLGYEVVGRADESTVLLIVGEGGDRNGTKLRDAAERGIPCMDVRTPGRFKDAVRAGELTGGDPLPEPAKVDRSDMSERERNRAVRRWARANGYAVPDRGRIPMHVRHAYELTHRDSQGKAAAA
ncbi:histone-like nucleoid-structuring protein Lsr2 [Streptomyces sp. NPDC001339]|uniref:Lsr2 family DNA-binding protein n=1 Tax=Streptomyces sp. NPDC001339 TaxID=3364563 RepID=UPI00369F7992